MPVLLARAALLLLVVPAVALAEEAPSPAPAEAPERILSATVDLPAHLGFSGIGAKVEARAHDRVGIAAYGGIGSLLGVDYHQYGGQVRWYAVGDFDHGLALGVDLNYLAFDEGLSFLGFDLFKAEGDAWAPGALVGYKVIFRPGITLAFDLGLRRHAISYSLAESVSRERYAMDGEGALWWPIADLNVGWSF